MRIFALLIAVAMMSLTMGTASAATKQCRDTHGKFMKCPVTTPAPKAPKHKPCHDPKTGKFVKCPV